MTVSVLLVEASPRRPADGVVETVRLAGGGAVLPYRQGGVHWRAGIMTLPKVITSLNYPGDDLGTGGMPQALTIGWSPSTRADLADMANLFWSDAAVTVRLGGESADLPPVLLTGTVLDAPVDAGSMQIALGDPAVDLKRPLLLDRFEGTGGVQGPVEWKGRLRPRAWGRCFNVPGEPIDPANNIYCFGDPARSWLSFDDVRDRGVSAETGDLTLLGWQGSIAATFAALQSTIATPGGGVLCPSIACIKWWTAPSELHADVHGETIGGYVDTAAEIAQRIVTDRSSIPFVAGTVAAAAALRPAACGWRADDETTTIATVLDQLLGDVSLLWVLTGGAILLRPWAWGASVAVGRSLEARRLTVHKPVGTRRLGYRRNHSVMARGDIAAILFASDVAFPDGTLLSDLQPAEPGATNGAPPGSPVGDEEAQAVIDSMRVGLATTALEAIRNGSFRIEQETRDENYIRVLDQVGVVVDGHAVYISFLREVDSEGNAQWAMTAENSSGAVTGIKNLLTGAGIGKLLLASDILEIVDPNGGAPIRVLSYGLDNKVYIGTDLNVQGDLIVLGSIQTGAVAANAISAGDTASLASPIAGNGAWHDAVTYNLTIPVSDPPVDWQAIAIVTGSQSFPSGDRDWDARLKADGVQIAAAGGQKSEDSFALSGRAIWGAGAHNITLEWNGQSGASLVEANMVILWLKR